ncbi:MAG: ABC transporter ATP-binding protein [Candidatus Sumerlaeia bacterium]|nr:ABC transporter ATP-binding protein [Candidatus Sumerlaeia bacterium]
MNTNIPMIKLENLSKCFEDIWAVKNINLEIKSGEVFAFLGPNGAGKTTTIKLIVGLLKPTMGRVFVAGKDVQNEPFSAKRLIGYVSDQPYLYEKLSGREFFYFYGELFGVPNDKIEEKLNYYFNLFGLLTVQDKLIENYSHGMRQKLSLSTALMHEPKVLVIDEPMVGLDPQSARLVKQIFRSQADRGNSVFLSTHTLSVAEEVADRIGIIHRGELLFVGTKDELRECVKKDGTLEDLFLELTASSG